jgi:hypothetical protein
LADMLNTCQDLYRYLATQVPKEKKTEPVKAKEKEKEPTKKNTQEWWDTQRKQIGDFIQKKDYFIKTGQKSVSQLDIRNKDNELRELERSPITLAKTANKDKIKVLRAKFNSFALEIYGALYPLDSFRLSSGIL